jgi:hypothetical protein
MASFPLSKNILSFFPDYAEVQYIEKDFDIIFNNYFVVKDSTI